MSNTLPSQKIVKGQIADASGHTDFTGSIDEAMDLIMNQVTKAGKWVYVNGNPFMFTSHSLAEQNELRGMLTNAEEPSFMLTAKLAGGAAAVAAVKTKVTKSPLSAVLNKNNRAQMAVSVKTRGGKAVIEVTSTDFAGGRKRLAKHREQILSAIYASLSSK